MQNFNEGVDYLVKHGLDGLAAADTLYVWLCAQGESEVDPTATYVVGQCVQVGSVVVTVAALACTSRVIDLGAADFTAAATGIVKSFVVTTKTPGAGALLLGIENIDPNLSNSHVGNAVNLATQGPLIADDLQIMFAYLNDNGTVA